MIPVSPVMPGSKPIEKILGKGQPEYIELPMVYLDTNSRPVISRWRLSDEERKMIADGGDVVLTQLTFGNLFHPVHLQVTMPDEMPVLLEE
jgi:hypothetical protein